MLQSISTKVLTLIFIITISVSSSAQWETQNLSEGRVDMTSVVVADDIYFIGGSQGGFTKSNLIDKYNTIDKTWSAIEIPGTTALQLSVAIDNKIYIRDFDFSLKLLHVYDTENNTWTELYTPSNASKLIASGRMIIGITSDKLMIYDVDTEVWLQKQFGFWPGASIAIADDQIFLAGGNGSDDVKIYNITTDQWTEDKISSAREQITMVSHEDRVFFIGGENDNFSWSDRVDIYDIATETWSIDSLSLGRLRYDVTIHKDKLYIAGGQTYDFFDQFKDVVDVYDLQQNTWEQLTLPTGRRYLSAIGHDGIIYFAGGDSDQEDNLSIVEMYNTSPVNTSNVFAETYQTYPNPTSNFLSIHSKEILGNLSIINLQGRVVKELYIDTEKYQLDVSDLAVGTYYLRSDDDKQSVFIVAR